jgi:hypothetical protein
MKRLSIFTTADEICPVTFVETLQIKEGVEADIYAFTEDSSRDIAIVKVIQGYKTPLQEIVGGDETIEGYMEGEGSLYVKSTEGIVRKYHFRSSELNVPITVKVGEQMQWHADSGNTDLIFYEICKPSYVSGRFTDLPGELEVTE